MILTKKYLKAGLAFSLTACSLTGFAIPLNVDLYAKNNTAKMIYVNTTNQKNIPISAGQDYRVSTKTYIPTRNSKKTVTFWYTILLGKGACKGRLTYEVIGGSGIFESDPPYLKIIKVSKPTTIGSNYVCILTPKLSEEQAKLSATFTIKKQ